MPTESRRVPVTRRNLPPPGRQSLRRWTDRTRWKLGERPWFDAVEQALDVGDADLAYRLALHGVHAAIAEHTPRAPDCAPATPAATAARVQPASPVDAACNPRAAAATAPDTEPRGGGTGTPAPEHVDAHPPAAAVSRDAPVAVRSAPRTWADDYLAVVARVLLVVGIGVVCAVTVAMVSAMTESSLGRTSAGRLGLVASAALFAAAVLALRNREAGAISRHRYEDG